MILLNFFQQIDIHQQRFYYNQIVVIDIINYMGASCCKIFSGNGPEEQQPQQNNKTELIPHLKAINKLNHTHNDKEFTYFLQAFQLRLYGELLKKAQYNNEQDPNFSYQKFQEAHRKYAQAVKNLGKYIEDKSNIQSPLSLKVAHDCKNIEQERKRYEINSSKIISCMVKLEIQAISVDGASEIGITYKNSTRNNTPFIQWVEIKKINNNPQFLQFIIPEVTSSFIILLTRPRKVQVEIDVAQSFEDGKTTICEVMPLKNGMPGEEIAIRMQLFDGKKEQEKNIQMKDLYFNLKKDFEGNQSQKIQEKSVEQSGHSRHFSSLNNHYNLNNNSMF